MSIKQISLFLENRSGALSEVCDVLAKADVNISTLSVADTTDFGILRLLVKDWEKAKTVLEQANFIVKITDVVAIKVEDKSGSLAGILHALAEKDINIEYMYAFTSHINDKAVLIFRFSDADEALKKIPTSVSLISETEFYECL